MTPALAAFQTAHPGLMVRYLTGERLFRLEYGEAHVAMRAGAAPDQPDNVVQPFVTLNHGLYAAKGYAARHGLPETEAELARHHFVADDTGQSRAPFLRWLRAAVPADRVSWRAAQPPAQREAVLAGAALGFLPVFVARGNAELIEVLPPRPEWASPLWLVTHVDLHRSAKVQTLPGASEGRREDLGRALSAARNLSGAARGHLAMLAFSGLVAGSFSLGSMIANDIAPTAVTAARFLIAIAVIGSLALATKGIPRAAFAAPWRYLVLGFLFGLYFVLMFEGLKTAPPVATAAVFTLTPLMSAGFGWLLLRQITTPRMAAALAIGGTGALWVIFRADLALLLRFEVGRGEFIYFWGCMAHALYTPLVRRLNRGESPVVFSLGMMVAALVLVTAYGWRDILATDWLALPPLVWATLAYLAVFASATTFVLLQYATLQLPSAKVMAYTYLTPSWVILWEIGLGRGAPPGLILVGVALAALALVMLVKDEG